MHAYSMCEVITATERWLINILPTDQGGVQSLVSWGRSLSVDTAALFFISLIGQICRLKSQTSIRMSAS